MSDVIFDVLTAPTRRMSFALAVLSALVLGACGAGGGFYYSEYKGYSGSSAPTDIIATLDWSGCKTIWRVSCTIDVTKHDPEGALVKIVDDKEARRHSRITLEPATYSVRVGFLGGGFLEPNSFGTMIHGTFFMEPGHTYVVEWEQWSTGGAFGPWTESWWIEDKETGEVVAGSTPPKTLPLYRKSLFGS